MEEEKTAEEETPAQSVPEEAKPEESTPTTESAPPEDVQENKTTNPEEQKAAPTEEETKAVDLGEENKRKEEEENLPRTSQDATIKENKILSLEYTQIVIEIGNQNKVLNDLKQRLIELAEQGPSACTASEIRGIRCCLEREKEKLGCLVQTALRFQQEHPSGPWEDIPLTTNISEDYMPSGRDVALCSALCRRMEASQKKILGERK